ncbi:TPA: phage tail protein [Escherichia coli]|nr:phage tail protein [Escherichia coli]HBE5377219.1 phage tail protein [Escherichia coli]
MSTTIRKFKTIITDTGAKKLAQAAAPDGKPVRLTHMAVGDGGGTLPTPDSKQTHLVHEVWRHTVNRITQDTTHQNRIIAELVIPPETGGFWIREIGVFDEHGDLIAVGNTAESYKPTVAEGSGRAQTFRIILSISTAAIVELTIDKSTAMASMDYVDEAIKEHEKSRNHPDATLSEKGFVRLSNDTDSDSETEAATPAAIKKAIKIASEKFTVQDATTTQKGIIQLSNDTDSESETEAATPKAVKAAYDLADGKYTAQDATTTQKGIVQLSSDTDSDSETEAATPKAIKAIKTDLDKKQPLNDMLTALSKLMPAGNAFPYFDADKKINLASISEIARQFISLDTLYSMQEFLVTPDLIARRIRSHSATFEPDVGNVFLAAYMRPADDFTMTARGRMVDGRYLRDINIELKPDMKTLIFNVDDIGTSSFPGSYAALYGYIGAITGYEIGLFIRFA